MKLEDQVCSLELAKKLKELGVKQESLFWWDKGDGIEDRLEFSPTQPLTELASAFTVAELGEMLPFGTTVRVCLDGRWEYTFCGIVGKELQNIWKEFTEADARAKMLIYLYEHKLITPPASPEENK